ncbi:MAG: PEP-utilizing enzyme [Microthrixaceae bacterium]|nr:PEP-utilizing enzyme [Microthrixaceae bacterium]
MAAVEAWERMPDLVGLDVEALVSLRRRLIDLAGRAMAAEVAIAATAVSDVARLESLLRRHLDPDDARNWALRATARPGGTIAGWPSAELDRVLSGAPVAVLRAIALASDPEEETMSLGASVNGAELLAAVFALVERAGSSAVLAGPTWDETPEAWWPVVQRAAGTVLRDREASNDAAPRESGLDELLDGLVANPEWTQARIRNLQVFDLRRFLIRRQAEEAADRLERRERTKAAVLTIGGLIRRVHLELGRRLVTAGVLEEADDVELLGEQELVHAMRGDGQLVPAPAELARRRRWLDAAADAGPLPQRFHGALPEKAPPAPTGAVLHGWGASPGRHRGPVRVVRHPTEADVDRGDVLVALSTDASWAPLFMQVGAVVVEEGGPLSHAAIVARELGLPAVVNIPGIVSRLAGPGQEVTVDGEAGTVEVHDTARSAR